MSNITANGRTFTEAIADAMNQVIAHTNVPATDASLAIPLRAQESNLTALAETLLGELLAEIGDGAQIGSVQIDGFMKRDEDYICWGYAFAAPERASTSSATSVQDLVVHEKKGEVEIRLNLEQIEEQSTSSP